MVQKYRNHRYPSSSSVEVKTPNGSARAQVLDVSQSGARLVGVGKLRNGDKVSLITRFDRIEATVRWAGQDRCGVSFPAGLPKRVMDSLKSSGHPGRMSHYSPAPMREMR